MDRRVSCLAAMLSWALGAPLLAQEPIELALLKPDPSVPAFGATEVEAEIYPLDAEIDRVEFFLDGLRMGVVRERPYRFQVEAGQDNVEHLFEVVAWPTTGESVSVSVRTPVIRSDLEIDADLRQLYVTVTRSGERVLDLSRDGFQIFDDETLQDLVTFERGDVPFSAVLLLDASSSMAGQKLETALAGVRRFLGSLGALDEAKLILFSDRILMETPSTNLSTLLTLGLEEVEPGGGTALNDAVYLAYKRLEERQGRKVIILLSDGIDIDSVLPMERVRWLSKRHHAALYWIRLPREGQPVDELEAHFITTWRSADEHRVELGALVGTVEESGGRIITITDIGEVEGAFQQLLSELREQYVLGYYPSVTRGTGAWHEIRVDAGEDDVRTRVGYLE